MERASIGRPEMRQSGRGGELAFDQSEEKAVEHDVLKNSHILGLSLSVFLCVCVFVHLCVAWSCRNNPCRDWSIQCLNTSLLHYAAPIPPPQRRSLGQ